MKLKKFIFILFVLLISFSSIGCESIANSYIWSNPSSSLLETVSDTETDLKLESDGAILIEQSTRFCFI